MIIKILHYERQGKNILRKEECIALSTVAKSPGKIQKEMRFWQLGGHC